ncbi:MAG: polysaccharide lyase family 7 protein [Parcubacteria group bacterium]|jgi:hypothetical protein
MDNKKSLIIKIVFGLILVGIVFFVLSSSRKGPVYKLPSVPKPAPVQQPAQPPAKLIDLTNWKLTLPITSPSDPTQPLEILQPELATYQLRPWFQLAPDKKGVLFRAPVNAPTTSNSSYPRCELREMTDSGTQEFFWPSTSGTHTLFLDEAITAVPQYKPDVVAGQIHGDTDDLIVVRLEGQKLYLARSKANLFTLDDNYVLGTRFTIKFVASNGQVTVYYNNSATPIYTLEKKVKQAYFKVGVYTQSNCKTEQSPELCTADNYGEVMVYQAKVTHE